MDNTFWDERYRQPDYAYGEAPNVFLKSQVDALPPGKILFPAEGEGRNAVYAARLGWEAYAFDWSVEGQQKADALAKKQGVSIQYHVGSFHDLPYEEAFFDAIALLYAHFAPADSPTYHKQLSNYLKPGGMVLLEGFSKKQVNHQLRNAQAGGPRNPDMLFAKADLASFFPTFETLLLQEQEVELAEGKYHQGMGSVIQYVGRKPIL